MPAGTLRCGSGITGSGAAAGVAPVVAGPFGSEALICTLPRAFGAPFGIGTLCAGDDDAPNAGEAIRRTIAPAIMQRCERSLIREFRWIFNAQSWSGFGPFTALWKRCGKVFPSSKFTPTFRSFAVTIATRAH